MGRAMVHDLNCLFDHGDARAHYTIILPDRARSFNRIVIRAMERNRSLDIRTQPNVGVTPRAGSVPNGFLFPDGGTFDFFGTKSRLYNTLPTKGNSLPRFRKQHESIEQPANFSGSVGHVVPKPTSWKLRLRLADAGAARRDRPVAQGSERTELLLRGFVRNVHRIKQRDPAG